MYFVCISCGISTHTLTWSVTDVVRAAKLFRVFQLTRSRGAWLLSLFHMAMHFVFQLTRSRGAWLIAFSSSWQMSRFQLTRSRGAWLVLLPCRNCQMPYFNSHAHVERDVWAYRITQAMRPFQLTRSRGAWLVWGFSPFSVFYFNSHAHVERDGQATSKPTNNWHFNSHAHVERD